MTTTLIINTVLALTAFAVIVGLATWGIATQHRDAAALAVVRRGRTRAPRTESERRQGFGAREQLPSRA
jgi:hypothetical protein